jgi:hypothetical protein
MICIFPFFEHKVSRHRLSEASDSDIAIARYRQESWSALHYDTMVPIYIKFASILREHGDLGDK